MRGPFSKRQAEGKRQRGGVLVLFAVCLLVMLCVLGLAIDTGIAYFAKARLSLAADSAVLAAANAYTHDSNPVTRDKSAGDAADAYFAANYPPRLLGTHLPATKLYISPAPDGTRLQYSVKTDSPLTFARLMSLENLQLATDPVVALRQSMGKVNVVMVLDRSTSVTESVWHGKKNAPLDPKSIAAALGNYVDLLDKDNTRVAVLPFSSPSDTKLALPFDANGFDPSKVKDAIYPYPGGSTNTVKALKMAVVELERIDKLQPDNAKKIILLATDGIATDGGSVSGPKKYPLLQDEAAIIRSKNIAIYSIGFGPAFTADAADQLKCLTGDADHPPSGTCTTGLYDNAKYCATAANQQNQPKQTNQPDQRNDLSHCLASLPSGDPIQVLVR